MAIGSPSSAVQGAHFNVVSKAVFRIKDMLKNEASVDDVACVGGFSRALARCGVGIKDGCAEPDGFEILSHHEALRNAVFAESGAGEAAEWCESSRGTFCAGPSASWKHDLREVRDRGPPAIRGLDNGAVFHDQRCVAEAGPATFLSVLGGPEGIHGEGRPELDMVREAIRSIDRWRDLGEADRAALALGGKAEPVSKAAVGELGKEKFSNGELSFGLRIH